MKVRFEEKAAVSSTALSVGDVSISAITTDVFCFVVFFFINSMKTLFMFIFFCQRLPLLEWSEHEHCPP